MKKITTKKKKIPLIYVNRLERRVNEIMGLVLNNVKAPPICTDIFSESKLSSACIELHFFLTKNNTYIPLCIHCTNIY